MSDVRFAAGYVSAANSTATTATVPGVRLLPPGVGQHVLSLAAGVQFVWSNLQVGNCLFVFFVYIRIFFLGNTYFFLPLKYRDVPLDQLLKFPNNQFRLYVSSMVCLNQLFS